MTKNEMAIRYWMPGVCPAAMVNAVLDLAEPDCEQDPFAWLAVCPFDEAHVVTVKPTLRGHVELFCLGGCSPQAVADHVKLACDIDEVLAA